MRALAVAALVVNVAGALINAARGNIAPMYGNMTLAIVGGVVYLYMRDYDIR